MMKKGSGRLSIGAAIATLAMAGSLLWVPLPAAGADQLTIMFGVFPGARGGQTNQQVLMSLESQLGRPFAGVRVFDLWNQSFPSSYDTWLRDTGHTLFLSVKARRTNGTTVLWRDIANAQPGSSLYNDILGWATAIRNFDAPIYFIFNHEPEAAASGGNGTAQEFISAWRRIVTIFRDQGVDDAKYVWTMIDYAFWRTDGGRAELWYPGDDYVDAIASDAYNWYNCRPGISTAWRPLEWIASHMRLFGQAHPDEQLMLMEWASHEDPNVSGRKATWINEAQALFKQPGWEQFKVVLYYHNSLKPTCNFWLDSSSSAMSAFAAMGNDPFYTRFQDSSSDTSPPSVPGQPSGQSNAPGSIDLSWPASTDDQATSLVYRVYRDGGSAPVGTVTNSSTTAVTYTDVGLPQGSTHTYRVNASDGANTSALSDASDPITVQGPPVSFASGFENGFADWTGVAGLTLDEGDGAPSPPSARAQTNASRAWAYRSLGGTYTSLCASARVKLTSTTDGASLFRLRTASDGPIIRVLVTSAGVLALRSDVSGAQISSGIALQAGSWSTLELCGSVGTSGSWTLYRDGTAILGPWAANTGTTAIGRVTIGTPDSRTITVNFDDVIVDSSPG